MTTAACHARTSTDPNQALEPAISAKIMELHHSKHHQTYVTNLNNAFKSLATAQKNNDVPAQIQLQPALRFNGGGHINHSLFWRNLAPADSEEAKTSSAPKLTMMIKSHFGGEEKFREKFTTALLGIQGSGWGWLVKYENENGRLGIVTTKDQDPVVGAGEVPIFGVDMWERKCLLVVVLLVVRVANTGHADAYYLDYLNGKAAYVQNIWTVINWKTAEERFLGSADNAFSVLKASI